MDKFIFIGGLPSSGSTLLTSLLNKNIKSITLNETGILTRYKKNHAPWIDLTAKNKDSKIKFSKKFLNNLKNNVLHDLEIFNKLRNQYTKDSGSFLIEKTPENIFAFDTLLQDNPNLKVVLTDRDMDEVVYSLRKRGFSLKEAVFIYSCHKYHILMLKKKFKERVFVCSYKKIINNSEEVISKIINFYNTVREYNIFEHLHKPIILNSWTFTPNEPIKKQNKIFLPLIYFILKESFLIEIKKRHYLAHELSKNLLNSINSKEYKDFEISMNNNLLKNLYYLFKPKIKIN